ncbi:MAG: hypothetical protein ACTHKQ_20165 [Mesorhizobium sp.]
MNRYRVFVAAMAISLVVPASAIAKDKVPELSASELAAAQSRTYNAPINEVFASAIAALQAQGYLDIQASKDAGTISGHTDAKSKLMYNIFWGLGKKKYTQTAQFLVEEIHPGQTTLTLNLFLNESKTRSIVFGKKATDATLIKQGQPYADLLANVDQQVARRAPAAVAGAVAQPAAVPPSDAPASPAEAPVAAPPAENGSVSS